MHNNSNEEHVHREEEIRSSGREGSQCRSSSTWGNPRRILVLQPMGRTQHDSVVRTSLRPTSNISGFLGSGGLSPAYDPRGLMMQAGDIERNIRVLPATYAEGRASTKTRRRVRNRSATYNATAHAVVSVITWPRKRSTGYAYSMEGLTRGRRLRRWSTFPRHDAKFALRPSEPAAQGSPV